jgi:hypothetical protein
MAMTPEDELPKRAILRAVRRNETAQAHSVQYSRPDRPLGRERPCPHPILTRKPRPGGRCSTLSFDRWNELDGKPER